jgi:hypothetical protein
MTDECISPLRRRMIEDMTVRNFVVKTQTDYIRRVKSFAVFLGRSPDTATREDVRRYLLHLASSGMGARNRLRRGPRRGSFRRDHSGRGSHPKVSCHLRSFDRRHGSQPYPNGANGLVSGPS